MAEDTEWQRQVPHQVPDHQAGDEHRRDDEVLHDEGVGAAGEGDDRGHGGEFVTDDDRVRGLQREIGPRAAHRDTGVGGGQRGRVVDSVADHQDPAPVPLLLLDGRDLVLGQQPGPYVGDAHLGGQPRGGARVVPGDQHGGAAGELRQGGDGGRGVRPEPVRDTQHTGRRTVHLNQYGGTAVLLQLTRQSGG